MSVWKFLGELSLFEIIRRWFSSAHHSAVPKPIPVSIPPVIRNQRVSAVSAVGDRCSVDELQERIDALESELDDLDIMSERYDDIQERIDILMDRIDEIEEAEDVYLMADDFDADHLSPDDDDYNY